MTNALIGICIVIVLAAIVFNYLPSVARKEEVARRLNAIIGDGVIKKRGRTSSSDRFIESLSRYAVARLQLENHLSTKDYKEKLFRAGYRSPDAEHIFLFARFSAPIAFAVLSVLYLFGLNAVDWNPLLKTSVVLVAAYVGFKLPDILIANTMQKRMAEITKVWPDALDLLVICVESGMTFELSLRAVARDIATQSKTFASELNYLLAEMSHLPNRADAYKSFANRLPISSIKATTTALIQSDLSGTAIGETLRAMADESRLERMQAAKKKAAGLGPKMTLPIVLFFVPSFLSIVIGPAVVSALGLN